ncbi:bssS family protein [Casimicrobium huifangae]|uniref:bssS family protein n=1 Tax=Casimicrobium huifangae TaxID=2591109 RepID=UPI003783C07C
MSNQEEVPLSPVAGWQTGVISSYGIGILTLHYLVSPMETLAQAHSSPTFALTPPQLRELGQKMIELAGMLESPQTPDPSIPRN